MEKPKQYELIGLSKDKDHFGLNKKHPKCEGYQTWTDWGWEYDCGCNTDISCDECKYGLGRKNPEAKCNQL